MPSYETLILFLKVMFFCFGASCILSSFLVLATWPGLFLVALFTFINGIVMLTCCIRAKRYTPREKYERDFS